jgi:glycosyltransferase involved in cell wall biosynthesis
MRTLQLISSAGIYGAENMLVNLARALKQQGCRSVVGVFHNTHNSNVEVAEKAISMGLPVAVFPCRGRADLGAIGVIQDYIQRHGIELVHSHGYKADVYGYGAAKRAGVPIVATCHNWPDKTASLRLYAFLDHLVLKGFPRLVAVSEGVRQSLERFGIPQSRVAIIANGIDFETFATARPTFAEEIRKNGRLAVGVVGRLVPAKGLEYLLRAAREIRELFPETLFVFIGDGPSRHNLEAMTRELRLEANVMFVGKRRDMPGVYASLDVLALPSLTEGMPMTILEALAARTPVVATRVGAVPRIVIPGQTGLLVNPGDATGLRDALVQMLSDRKLREGCGERGQAMVQQNFSSEAMASNYLGLYRAMLNGNGNGHPATAPVPCSEEGASD